MRRSFAWVMVALGSSVALAGPAPVIGGRDVPQGDLEAVAAILDGQGEPFCTGTLVAPTVVITAQHCIDSSLDSVLLGTNNYEQPENGETIKVIKKVGYPNGFNSFDVGVLVLESAATTEPRPIAAGWASLGIKNGAMATIAGYGAIDRNSNSYIPTMQEAEVPITDADCTTSQGCNGPAKPAGELGAGGMGVDTCEGDSGGPLFVTGTDGLYLAGVTSRGYDDNQFVCSEGGIYARPDKIIAWIESTAGVPVLKGAVPTWDELRGPRGGSAQTRIDANDPASDNHTFEITTQPTNAMAKIRDDGTLRTCNNPGVFGDDRVVVTITDTNDPSRELLVVVPLFIEEEQADGDCSLDDFDAEGGGCCDSGRPRGSLLIGFAVGALLLRRRRSPTRGPFVPGCASFSGENDADFGGRQG